MPKPTNVSPEQYQSLRAKHTALRDARVELERARSLSGASVREPYSTVVSDALVLELEALIAAEQGGAALNRAASDLEEIRSYLEAELAIAREAFATPAPEPLAPLAGPSKADLTAYVASIEAYQLAYDAHRAAQSPAHTRLSRAYAAASDAAQLVFAARKKAHMYPSARVVPHGPANSVHPRVPATVAQCDEDLAVLASQRVDKSPNGHVSEAERKLRELRMQREAYDSDVAAQEEADRINALPPKERRLALDRLDRALAAG